ncbi:FG-GAP-like repeat-containing protein [Microlunatus sp. GCM10028923]|uniref:FG-GAP-like repeat-containing protein n=1 Tax=Microlunatus sp. GCM10028923 TaxID=3273400 RepID=UPI00361C833D
MATPTEPTILRDHGFADLSRGTLGNAGQNLYVSRAGVLQRIAYASLTGSGYVDLPFANSHDDGVSLPAYLYLDPLNSGERLELDTFGAYAGAAGDLTGDGYDDLVIANQYDGATNELYGQVYFGGPDGYRRKRMLQLWAPSSKDVVIGTFAPGARPSILFVSRERLRRFDQDDHGFAARRFDDLALPDGIESITAGDLDGDGVDDLVVRSPDGRVRILWGGPGGLDPDRSTLLPADLTAGPPIETRMDTAAMGAAAAGEGLGATGLFVDRPPTASRLKIISLAGRNQLFLCPDATTSFVAFDAVREPTVTLRLDSGPVISAAVGDVTGDGRPDLVLATRQVVNGSEWSLFHGGTADEGFAAEPIMIETRSANDVVIADLDGDGRGEVIVCQDQLPDSYTHESLIFAGTPAGPAAEPRRLLTHCALDVLIIRWPPDGRPKPIFVNHLSNTVRGNVNSVVYLGGPDGYAADRKLEFPGWAATELKFVDFTDSGAPDVYVANSNENWLDVSNGSFVYYRRGDAFPITDRVELPTEHNMSGVVADLDRNGYLDLITTGWGQDEIVIFRGGPAGFGAPERIKLTIDGRTYDQPRYLSLADLNRDGWLDLIIPELGRHGGVIILWGGPDGFSAERSTVLDCGTAVSSRVADLDGDGWLDLIIGGFKGDDPRDDYRTFVYVYWGGPDGLGNDRRTQLPANFPVDVGVADLDNDGRLDLVVTNYHGHQNRDLDSYIYWGGPDGDFHPHRITRLFHHSACGVLLADFDEDGYVDLAIANHKTYGNHPGESYVWHNGPDGFSPDRRTTLPTAGPHGLSHLDFGNVYDRGSKEYFESRVLELDRPGTCTGLEWTGDVPAKTWVTAWLRSAGSPDDLARSPWIPIGPTPSIPVQRFVQYRLALGATNSVATPRLTGVELIVSAAAP